ncbi:MAG: hypothetical protein SNG60_06875 [Rikenellaceae bacterium]
MRKILFFMILMLGLTVTDASAKKGKKLKGEKEIEQPCMGRQYTTGDGFYSCNR